MIYDITPEGRVINMRLLESSGDPRSDNEVLETLRRWRFDPKTVIGGRRNIRIKITFERDGSTFQHQNQERRKETKHKVSSSCKDFLRASQRSRKPWDRSNMWQ